MKKLFVLAALGLSFQIDAGNRTQVYSAFLPDECQSKIKTNFRERANAFILSATDGDFQLYNYEVPQGGLFYQLDSVRFLIKGGNKWERGLIVGKREGRFYIITTHSDSARGASHWTFHSYDPQDLWLYSLFPSRPKIVVTMKADAQLQLEDKQIKDKKYTGKLDTAEKAPITKTLLKIVAFGGPKGSARKKLKQKDIESIQVHGRKVRIRTKDLLAVVENRDSHPPSWQSYFSYNPGPSKDPLISDPTKLSPGRVIEGYLVDETTISLKILVENKQAQEGQARWELVSVNHTHYDVDQLEFLNPEDISYEPLTPEQIHPHLQFIPPIAYENRWTQTAQLVARHFANQRSVSLSNHETIRRGFQFEGAASNEALRAHFQQVKAPQNETDSITVVSTPENSRAASIGSLIFEGSPQELLEDFVYNFVIVIADGYPKLRFGRIERISDPTRRFPAQWGMDALILARGDRILSAGQIAIPTEASGESVFVSVHAPQITVDLARQRPIIPVDNAKRSAAIFSDHQQIGQLLTRTVRFFDEALPGRHVTGHRIELVKDENGSWTVEVPKLSKDLPITLLELESLWARSGFRKFNGHLNSEVIAPFLKD